MPLFGPPNIQKMKEKGDVKGLIRALSYEKDIYIQKAAWEALLEMGHIKKAAQEIAKLGHPWVTPHLIHMLNDARVKYRVAAAKALQRLKDPRAIHPLIASLDDETKPMQNASTLALVAIGAPAIEPLIEALKAEQEKVREGAAEALADIGPPAMEPLIYLLFDENDLARKHAAQALGIIGDTRAVNPLIRLLNDWESEVREMAAWALGQIGDTRAEEPLRALLKDTDYDVRTKAEEALSQMGIEATL